MGPRGALRSRLSSSPPRDVWRRRAARTDHRIGRVEGRESGGGATTRPERRHYYPGSEAPPRPKVAQNHLVRVLVDRAARFLPLQDEVFPTGELRAISTTRPSLEQGIRSRVGGSCTAGGPKCRRLRRVDHVKKRAHFLASRCEAATGEVVTRRPRGRRVTPTSAHDTWRGRPPPEIAERSSATRNRGAAHARKNAGSYGVSRALDPVDAYGIIPKIAPAFDVRGYRASRRRLRFPGSRRYGSTLPGFAHVHSSPWGPPQRHPLSEFALKGHFSSSAAARHPLWFLQNYGSWSARSKSRARQGRATQVTRARARKCQADRDLGVLRRGQCGIAGRASTPDLWNWPRAHLVMPRAGGERARDSEARRHE